MKNTVRHACRKALIATLLCIPMLTASAVTWDQLLGQGIEPDIVTYKKLPERDLHLQIYNPTNRTETPGPAILFIHGGGWSAPGIWNLAPHCRYYAGRGITAVNIEYRLMQQDPSYRINDCIADSRDALRFLQQNADAFAIDPQRIAVAGESAGGHLAAAITLLPTDTPPAPPAAMILLDAPLDLESISWIPAHTALAPTKATPEDESIETRMQRYSPMNYIRAGLPPTLLIHGDADRVVPLEQSTRFADRMRHAGNRVELKSMHGWSHAFAIDGYGSESQIGETLRIMDRFLEGLGWTLLPPAISTDWAPTAWHPTFSGPDTIQPHVRARSHHLRFWPFLDGQWLGIVNDPDGYTWFAFSTHSGTEHGQVFRYDPINDRINHIADLGQATGEKLTGNPPQDKIHGDMFVEGDHIYTGTCEGHTISGNPYRGAYWLSINRHTGDVTNMGKSISEDGLLAIGFDPVHRRLYGHTNRKGWLTRLDLETGKETFVGVPWQDVIDNWKASESPSKPREIWPRGFDMMITGDGRVFGAKPAPGTFWVYDPEHESLDTFKLEMPLPANLQQMKADKNIPPHEWYRWQNSAFHRSTWNEEDQCFYLMRSYDQMLCRFYPPDGKQPARIETLQAMGLAERRHNLRPASSVLVIAGRTVYYTPHTGWGGITHLISYQLDDKIYTDHGPIIVEGGRYVNECHAMTATPDAKLHLAAFVYSKPGTPDPVTPWAMRDSYPFHSRFVIIDPQTDLLFTTKRVVLGFFARVTEREY